MHGRFSKISGKVFGMATKGFRATFVSIVAEVDAGLKRSQTTETLIGYTACWRFGFNYLQCSLPKQFQQTAMYLHYHAHNAYALLYQYFLIGIGS
jgi:hypothetical protein